MLTGGSNDKPKTQRTPLRYLLRPNTVYNVEGFNDLKYIISTNTDITCELWEMNFGLNTIEKRSYNKICVSHIGNNEQQRDIYDMYKKGVAKLTTTVSGIDEYGIQKILINDLHNRFMYVHTDDSSRFTKITILKYSAPLFKEYEYAYTGDEKATIRREQQLFGNIYYNLYAMNYPSVYEQKIMRKYSGLRIKKGECKPIVSVNNTVKTDIQRERILRYKKYLDRQNLDKLQKIAKKRSIVYTKKKNGKTTNIKKATLIDKLSDSFFQMKM